MYVSACNWVSQKKMMLIVVELVNREGRQGGLPCILGGFGACQLSYAFLVQRDSMPHLACSSELELS